MLSNAEDAFSCGEVNALFRPYRVHHFNPVCGCGNPACDFWARIRSAGERRLWQSLQDAMPDVAIFVDSSKDPLWIRDQVAREPIAGLEVDNVLVWKTPLEYAASCLKRGQLRGWRRSYVTYHKRYFGTVASWVSVRYAELASNPRAKCASVCRALGLRYREGMEAYWTGEHHTLFGSDTAKAHLRGAGGAGHRTVSYVSPTRDDRLRRDVQRELDRSPEIRSILHVLSATEVDCPDPWDRSVRERRLELAPSRWWPRRAAIRLAAQRALAEARRMKGLRR